MPSLNDTRQKRESEARRLADQPTVIRMNSCSTCGAANPTTTAEPVPQRCASCGDNLKILPAWACKGRVGP